MAPGNKGARDIWREGRGKVHYVQRRQDVQQERRMVTKEKNRIFHKKEKHGDSHQAYSEGLFRPFADSQTKKKA